MSSGSSGRPVRPDRLIADRRRQHALRRAAERYGLSLTKRSLFELEARIGRGDRRAIRLGHRPGGALLVALHVGGDWLPVVWSERFNQIVTFLPPHEFAHYRGYLGRIDPETGLPREREPIKPVSVEVEMPAGELSALGDADLSDRVAELRAEMDRMRALRETLEGQSRTPYDPTIHGEPADYRAMRDDVGRGILDCCLAVRKLRQAAWEASRTLAARRVGLLDPDDPGPLLRVAAKTIARLRRELGRHDDQEVRAVCHAINYWIARHRPEMDIALGLEERDKARAAADPPTSPLGGDTEPR